MIVGFLSNIEVRIGYWLRRIGFSNLIILISTSFDKANTSCVAGAMYFTLAKEFSQNYSHKFLLAKFEELGMNLKTKNLLSFLRWLFYLFYG